MGVYELREDYEGFDCIKIKNAADLPFIDKRSSNLLGVEPQFYKKNPNMQNDHLDIISHPSTPRELGNPKLIW